MIELGAEHQLDQSDKLDSGQRCAGSNKDHPTRAGPNNIIKQDGDVANSSHLLTPNDLFGQDSGIAELESNHASLAATSANNEKFATIKASTLSSFDNEIAIKQSSARTSISSTGISSCSPESLSSPAFSSSSTSLSNLSPLPQANKNHRNKNVNLSSVAEPERRYRPQKYCAVCGDKAIACNFNAVTCESCKAFFRRNAFKEQQLKCLFENSCVIDRVTRRFCSKCRLLKCFKIGMKREWILTDEQKQIKRVKIMQNKQSRQQISTISCNTLVDDEFGSSESRDKQTIKSIPDDSSGTEVKSVLIHDEHQMHSTSSTKSSLTTNRAHGDPIAQVNKYGVETRDVATSCPDETDLQNGLIGHHCSLSYQCCFCSNRISSVLQPTCTDQLNTQYSQYNRTQQVGSYNHHHHHHYTQTLNHQRPTQIGANLDIQDVTQSSNVINGGDSQAELTSGQQYLAPMDTCAPGCCCQPASTPTHFNISHQHHQLQHGQQNIQMFQGSTHGLGQTKQPLEYSTSSSNMICNQDTSSTHETQQPDLHVLRPANESRTTSAVNLTRTKPSHCPNSRNTSRSDCNQYMNHSEERIESGDRLSKEGRHPSFDPEQISTCSSTSIKNAGQSSWSQSHQNPFTIALEAMNVAGSLAHDHPDTESMDCTPNCGNISQTVSSLSCNSYEDENNSLGAIGKLAETSEYYSNRATSDTTNEMPTTSNPPACELQSSSQITSLQVTSSATITKSANGAVEPDGSSKYVLWKGETFHKPATTEEEAISRVERLDFSDSEKHLIHEMIDATKFIFKLTTDRVCSPTKLDDMVQFCDAALRRLIKSVKQIRAFRILSMDDQIKLLKTACFKILLLRSAFHFREEDHGWKDERTGRKSCLEVLKEAKKSLVYEKHYQLLQQITLPLRKDRIILATLAMALLFEPDINLRHNNSVGLDNLIYLSILRKYLLGLQPDPLAKYERLISALQLLDDCNDEYNVFFSKDFQPEQVTPLLIEIFDIPINNSN